MVMPGFSSDQKIKINRECADDEMKMDGKNEEREAGVDWLSVGAVCFGSRICGLVMLCGLWLIVLLVLLILPYTDKWKISLEVISFSENYYTLR